MNDGRTRVIAKLLALLTTIAALPAVQGEAAHPMPVAVPSLDLPEGYDWESRINSTHVLVDVTPLMPVADARSATTPYLDLELIGLMPWRPYELVLGPLKHRVYTDAEGHGVGWNVIAETAEWTLIDSISMEPIGVVVVLGPVGDEIAAPVGGRAIVACYRCRYQPPAPSEMWLEESLVIEQALYSFTEGVAIRGSRCYNHAVTVGGKVSGGLAGREGTAGGSRTWESEHCAGLYAPPGRSIEYRRYASFKKDVYEDGSWKIYSLGPAQGLHVGEFEAYFDRPSETYDIHVEGLTTPVDVLTLRERGAGGVSYQAGAKAFGVDIGVVFSATSTQTESNQITFVAQPQAVGDYDAWWVNGDRGASPQRGIVAMVWERA